MSGRTPARRPGNPGRKSKAAKTRSAPASRSRPGPKPKFHILFRDLRDNVAPDCAAHCNWQVVYHKGGRGFPSGLAWVLVPSEPEASGPSVACEPTSSTDYRDGDVRTHLSGARESARLACDACLVPYSSQPSRPSTGLLKSVVVASGQLNQTA